MTSPARGSTLGEREACLTCPQAAGARRLSTCALEFLDDLERLADIVGMQSEG